ncbi:hydrogenase maturation protease [Longilinea arvoryzae]|uniref:Hydrogenase maturation protease n=1 Tax=Longilinea arvoryzae TaxID=360412 RepID=A0A0S7BJF3_9CHLR|nr:hydrogenase maturation protease [Longilinea arvoryzae]GAP14322.1 hydrogenase maturation protease [Longilinea arvoryzae]
MGQKLVIGYGNPLRTDDGLGLRAVETLLTRLPCGQCEAITNHQLVPELAEKIARADRVAFIDASSESHGREAGTIRQRPVRSDAVQTGGLSHHVAPECLVALAGQLYGYEPQAVLFTVEAQSFELGENLTPPVQAALPELIDQIMAWIG